MSRRHNLKRNRVKSAVETRRIVEKLDTPKVTEVAEGTPGAVPVKQEDGSTKFFLVERERVTVIRGRALDRTVVRKDLHGKERNQKNAPENMAPKGKGGSAPAPGKSK